VAVNHAGTTPVVERYEPICTENNIGFGNIAVGQKNKH
jgi:hypothetical protein